MGLRRVTSSPPQTFCYADQGGSEAPSKTDRSRDAAAKPPWMALRRVFDGAPLPKFQIAGIKKAHLSALFWLVLLSLD